MRQFREDPSPNGQDNVGKDAAARPPMNRFNKPVAITKDNQNSAAVNLNVPARGFAKDTTRSIGAGLGAAQSTNRFIERPG